MRTTQQVWNRDMASLEALLAPFVIEFEDGFQGIGPGAPAETTRLYSKMVSIGYANGWFA